MEIRSTYMVPKVNRLPMSSDRKVFQEIRKRRRVEKAHGVIGEGELGDRAILLPSQPASQAW